MNDFSHPPPPKPSRSSYSQLSLRTPGCLVGILTGAGVGAVSGALARAFVALLFIYSVDAGGGSFFRSTFSTDAGLWDVITEYRALLMTSGTIGLFVCGLSGATCRVLIAAPVGALLSALPCLVLAVFPSVFLMSMSGGNNEPDVQAVFSALVGMVIAGAIASSAGALAGKYAMRQMWRSTGVSS